MSSDKDLIDIYVFNKYITKIINRYENELIEAEKVQQYLETLERWENKFKKLSMIKQNNLRFALQELT